MACWRAWCYGPEVTVLSRPGFPEASRRIVAPLFAEQCLKGDVRAVRAALDAARASGGDAAVRELVHRRHSNLRYPALLWCIVGARLIGLSQLAPEVEAAADHMGVLKLLCDAGADVCAKDIIGQTPLHHCLSVAVSRTSLLLAAELLRRGGSDVNARNRGRRSLLTEVVQRNEVPPFLLLLEAGADAGQSEEGVHGVFVAGVATALGFTQLLRIIPLVTQRGRTGAGKTLEGERVVLRNLKTGALNGQTGVAGPLDPFAERYAVTLDSDGRKLAVPFHNVWSADKPMGTASCAHCGKPAGLRCARCLRAFFCDAACQRAAWKAHKPDCKQKQGAGPSVLVRKSPLTGTDIGDHHTGKVATLRFDAAAARSKGDFQLGEGFGMVKVQAPNVSTVAVAADGGDGPGAYDSGCTLLLYTEHRGMMTHIVAGDPAFEPLLRTVRERGVMGLKAYFLAKAEADAATGEDVLRVFLEPQPLQPW